MIDWLDLKYLILSDIMINNLLKWVKLINLTRIIKKYAIHLNYELAVSKGSVIFSAGYPLGVFFFCGRQFFSHPLFLSKRNQTPLLIRYIYSLYDVFFLITLDNLDKFFDIFFRPRELPSKILDPLKNALSEYLAERMTLS